MSIHFACPSCGQTLAATPDQFGQATACVGCGHRLTVPALGILVPARPREDRTKPAVPAPAPTGRQFWVAGALLGAGVLLLGAVAAVGWHLRAGQPPQENETAPPSLARSETPTKRTEYIAPLPDPSDEGRSLAVPVRPTEARPPVARAQPTPPPERTPPPDPAPGPRVIKPFAPVWRLNRGDVFVQELTVGQKSNLRVQGIPVSVLLQYRVWSRFTVEKTNADGSLLVGQKVERAQLLQADDLTRGVLGDAVGRLAGTEFRMKLNRDMEVVDFQGAAGRPLVGGIQLPAGPGAAMVSLLDRDGWKELAQATFFNRDKPLTKGARWSKPLTHQWGPLGMWAGQIHYAYVGPEGGAQKIAYAMQLAHKAAAGGLVMGMPVGGANFQAPEAGGVLYFDLDRGRVVAAEERFRVRGVLHLRLLGQNTPIEIDEEQQFQIRIADAPRP